jgi:hypothetical protein
MSNTIEVFLNEEYGYKTWIWKPNMTEDAFVNWWQNLTESEFIKYYFNINALPGTLKEYKEKNQGNALQREAGDPTSHRPYYYCHFHDVDDSYIAISNDLYKFQNRTKYDWKDHWIDHTLSRNKHSISVK